MTVHPLASACQYRGERRPPRAFRLRVAPRVGDCRVDFFDFTDLLATPLVERCKRCLAERYFIVFPAACLRTLGGHLFLTWLRSPCV